MILGAKHVEFPFVEVGQVSSILYFSYFIFFTPIFSLMSNTLIDLRKKSVEYKINNDITNYSTTSFPTKLNLIAAPNLPVTLPATVYHPDHSYMFDDLTGYLTQHPTGGVLILIIFGCVALFRTASINDRFKDIINANNTIQNDPVATEVENLLRTLPPQDELIKDINEVQQYLDRINTVLKYIDDKEMQSDVTPGVKENLEELKLQLEELINKVNTLSNISIGESHYSAIVSGN